jgi:hypothetical protein
MLRHCLAFATQWGILGRPAESQIESFHARFNHFLHERDFNLPQRPAEQLRRSLADSVELAFASACVPRLTPWILDPI